MKIKKKNNYLASSNEIKGTFHYAMAKRFLHLIDIIWERTIFERKIFERTILKKIIYITIFN